MFASTAFAQTPAGAAGGGFSDQLLTMLPFLAMFVLGYFFLIRPQQQRARQHQAQLKAIKRGDSVVLASGVVGRVTSVADAEVSVEIAPKVEVKVVKSMISDVRVRGAPAPANDPKA